MSNTPKRSRDEEGGYSAETMEIDINTKRIESLEREVKRMKKDMKDSQEVQVKHDQLIHGLEKVTRGHNLRIFGLDRAYLFSNKLIKSDDYNAVFEYLCVQGLRISQDTTNSIKQYIDIIHDLPVGFIISFTRRQDRQYILQQKKNLKDWHPCISMGPRYKFVSVQIDLANNDLKQKKERNAIVDKYRKAGIRAKFVGWNKIAIGDEIAKHYKEFPTDPKEYKKND